MMSSVLIGVVMIGSMTLANEPLITLVEYTSLKELAQVARGISLEIGAVIVTTDITSLMIYLVNADQSRKNNIKIPTLLVHN